MQSIFRPASRREALGEHSGGDRRDGGLIPIMLRVFVDAVHVRRSTGPNDVHGGRYRVGGGPFIRRLRRTLYRTCKGHTFIAQSWSGGDLD